MTQNAHRAKGYYNYVGIYVFFYGGMGMLAPLIGQYLAGIGFDGVQIGFITSAATAVGIFAAPFWGCRYHSSKTGFGVVLFLCVGTAFITANLMLIKYYLFFLIIYGLYAFLQSPLFPLCDAMALEAELPFGAIRKWGAIGYASGVFIAGQVAEVLGPVAIFPMSASSYFLTGVIIWIIMRRRFRTNSLNAIPNQLSPEATVEVPPCQEDKAVKRGAYRTLLRNRKFIAVTASAFFVGGTNIANNIFFGFLYTDAGGNIAGIGIAFLLMSGSEAPFMAWTEKLSAKFTMERLILAAMILSALRFMWYSTGLSPHLLVGTFFLQGMVNGILLVELVRYVAKVVQPEIIGVAMTLYQSISSNGSAILCQLAGGFLLEKAGSQQVYLFFGIFNIIGIMLYTGFGLHKSDRKRG